MLYRSDRAARLLLTSLLVMGAGLFQISPDQSPLWSIDVALADPGIGADTWPQRLHEGEGGTLSEQGLTHSNRPDPEQIPQTSLDVDEDDADPIGSESRWTILMVLALVLGSIGFYYVRRTDPIRE